MKINTCRGCGEQIHDRPCTPPVSRLPDFPLVIQTVMFAADQKTGIAFNANDTASLAAEIRKLMGRE